MLGPQTRPGALFAALVVTWVAVVLLMLIVVSLHARLRRLERGGAAPGHLGQAGGGTAARPYGALLGRQMSDLVGSVGNGEKMPRVLLLLSATCTSCRSLLTDLADPSWTTPTAVAWVDGPPAAEVPATVLADGPRISAVLGVGVTPFGLVAGADGRVTWAGPVTSLRSLAHHDRLDPQLSATGKRQQ